MPVFRKHNKKILFIHVPKAGGTSIENFFLKNSWKIDFLDDGQNKNSWNHFLKCSPQHMHKNMLETIFNLSSFDLIFMTVRNPIERIKSEFKWRNKFNMIDQNSSYESWITATLDKYRNDHYIYDNHIRQQIEFMLPKVKIFKLEEGLDEIPIWIEKELNISFQTKNIEKVMKSEDDSVKRNNYNLSDTLKKRLLSFYSDDIKKYNY